MGQYLGDFAEDATIRGSFNTRDSGGAPITLAGSPTLAVYKDAGVTESTAGVTLTVDFDSRTGHHVYTIDTSADAFYATGADYRVVITAGTVDEISVVGVEVGAFSIQNRYMRGTDNANTTAPDNTAIQAIDSRLPADPAAVSDLADIKGATFDAATDSLEAIREAVDAGGVVNVLPAVGIVADRSPGATITPVVGETISQSITLYATDGTTPINLSGKTLAIVFETLQGVDVAVVASGSITISGDDSNVVSFAYPSDVTASERTLRFAIRDAAAPLTMYLQGLCIVTRAPQVD